MTSSEGTAPYCVTYNYASGSKGFGCAVVTGYNKTVLTTPTSGGPTPFGGNSATPTSSSSSSSMTSSSSSSSISTTTVTATAATPTVAAVHTTSLGGGAIAGIAVGAVVVIAVLAGLIWARIRRQRIKNRQDAQAQQTSNAPSYHQGRFIYPQYPKTEPGLYSLPLSPPSFSRHHSTSTATVRHHSQNKVDYHTAQRFYVIVHG